MNLKLLLASYLILCIIEVHPKDSFSMCFKFLFMPNQRVSALADFCICMYKSCTELKHVFFYVVGTRSCRCD